ncbi:MAG: hypothetical protein ACHQYQ_06550 [Bacteriovoracales bacterium]|jgi:hypothetical protein
MFKILFLCIPFIVSAADIDEIKALGEQIEGCPNGCECIIDASRENRARRKLGEYEVDTKGLQEDTREIKTRTK